MNEQQVEKCLCSLMKLELLNYNMTSGLLQYIRAMQRDNKLETSSKDFATTVIGAAQDQILDEVKVNCCPDRKDECMKELSEILSDISDTLLKHGASSMVIKTAAGVVELPLGSKEVDELLRR